MGRLSKAPFRRMGSKYRILPTILSHLPNDAGHFCDVFGGTGAILLNRKPAPLETLNDIDGDVVNFFHVLRNDTDAIVEKLRLTPYSRKEYELACRHEPNGDPIEDARMFFVRSNQSFLPRDGIGYWRRCSPENNMMKNIASAVKEMHALAERLMHVQIEDKPALDLLSLYDGRDVLFYLDPPYMGSLRESHNSTRVMYNHDMKDKESHRTLAATCMKLRGRVAVSGYRSKFYDDLYHGWERVDMVAAKPTSSITKKKKMKQECLWMNYDIDKSLSFVL